MNANLNFKIETISAKIISIESDNRMIVQYSNKLYPIELNDSFLDSFNQIKAVFNASETVIHKDDVSISLVNIQIDGDEIRFRNSLKSYIVLEPEWLVNVTALTQFDFCERSLFNNRLLIKWNYHKLNQQPYKMIKKINKKTKI